METTNDDAMVSTQIGDGSAGSGADAVRVTTVLGDREGPVGTAWATALATQTENIVLFATSLPAASMAVLEHAAHNSCAPVAFAFLFMAQLAPHAQQVAVN